MLILASLLLGLTMDLWQVPILAGLVGEVAHFASSKAYRYQLRAVPRARQAAVLTAVTLSVVCMVVFWIGYGIRHVFGSSL